MNRYKLSLGRTLSLAVALCDLLLASCPLAEEKHPPSPNNILANPGFETGDFTGWTVSGDSPNYGVNVAGYPITGTGAAGCDLLHRLLAGRRFAFQLR